jgi:hypothetical protein
MSVLQIQTRKRSDDATEDLSDALKALADSGVRCYGTPGQDESRHRSIIVDDKQAWVAVCVLKGAGFRLRRSPASASDCEIPVRSDRT